MLSNKKKKKEVLPLPLKDVKSHDTTTVNNNNSKWFAFYKEKFGSSPPSSSSSSRTTRRISNNKLLHQRPSELAALLPNYNKEKRVAHSGSPNEQQVACNSMKGRDSIVLPLAYKRIPSYEEERRRSPVRVLGGAAAGGGGNRDPRKLAPLGRSVSSKNLDTNLTNSDIRGRRSSVANKDVDNNYFQSSRAYGSGVGGDPGKVLPAAGRPSGSSAARDLYKRFESLPSYQAEVLRGSTQVGRRRSSTSGTTLLTPVPSSSQESKTYGKGPQTTYSSTKVRKPSYTRSSGFGYSNEGRGAGPSFSDESSSESSNESLGIGADDGSSHQHRIIPVESNNADNSSCSSSRSISPLSLNSRLTELKLLNPDQHQQQAARRPSPTTDEKFVPSVTSSERRPSQSNSLSRAGSSSSGVGQRDSGGNRSSYTSREVHGLVGLVNEGNTCYLNSCLQCLAHSMPLASALQGPVESLVQTRRGSGSRAGTSGERDFSSLAELLAYSFRQVVRDLWQRPAFSATSARMFLQCVQAWAPQFAGHSQHDAQEVLRAILDGLHEALNRVTTAPPYRDLYLEPKPEEELAELTWKYHKLCQDSIIQDIFCGQLQSTIECCTCHRKSHCFDPFHDLSLPLPKNEREGSARDQLRGGNSRSRVTLHDCLSAFVAPEQLEGSNKYYCPSCKAPRTSMKKLTLYRLPPILVLHIKRFYKSDRFSYQKDDTPVLYPLQGLDFTDFLSARARKVRRGGLVYDLYGVCCHVGSLGCGHYSAQCRNCENDMWYCFNDSSVSPVQDTNVLSSSAYILFYQQRS